MYYVIFGYKFCSQKSRRKVLFLWYKENQLFWEKLKKLKFQKSVQIEISKKRQNCNFQKHAPKLKFKKMRQNRNFNKFGANRNVTKCPKIEIVKKVPKYIISNHFSDLLTASCMMPLNLTGYVLKRWPFGADHISCSLQAFVYFCCGYTSIVCLLAITLNRFVIIIYRDLYIQLFSRRNVSCLRRNFCPKVYFDQKLLSKICVRISSTFSVFDHFHIFALFCISTIRLYFDLNLTSTFLAKLYFGQNFTWTSLLIPKLYFDPYFSTNKNSRFDKKVKVQRSK